MPLYPASMDTQQLIKNNLLLGGQIMGARSGGEN